MTRPSKRRLIAVVTSVVAAIAAAAALALPALASSTAPTHKNVHFTDTIVGASVSSTVAPYEIHDSIKGNAAGVQTITSTSATGGTDTSTSYWGNATDTTHDTFTFSAPNAQGLIPLVGKGHDVSGTGEFKHIHSTYTFHGTYDPKTTIYRVVLNGTESY
jgi:hypothetical protein